MMSYMVVHAGRDQEVAHAVHADKKGVCRLVACAVVLVWKLKTWGVSIFVTGWSWCKLVTPALSVLFFQFMSVTYTLWLYKNRVFLCKNIKASYKLRVP